MHNDKSSRQKILVFGFGAVVGCLLAYPLVSINSHQWLRTIPDVVRNWVMLPGLFAYFVLYLISGLTHVQVPMWARHISAILFMMLAYAGLFLLFYEVVKTFLKKKEIVKN